MRATVIIFLCVLGLACDRGAATTAPAARLGTRTLTTDRLAEILVLSQPLPLEHAVAAELAREWLNLTAIAERTALGDSLTGSAWADEATWLDRRTATVDAWVSARAPEPQRQAEAITDSVYSAGNVRLFAHIFKRVGTETRPEEKALQHAALERIRNGLIAGGVWSEANRESDDEASRSAGGIIGLIRRGDLVPEFEQAAFSLQPGQLSPVVETRYGFHIIHRPTLREARRVFVDRLAREMAVRTDSMFADGLLADQNVTFAADAAATTKAVAADPWPALTGDRVVATHDAGTFTENELARYLVHYPADARAEMTAAPDSALLAFLRPLVFESIVVALAARDNVTMPPDAQASILESYRTALDQLLGAVRLRPAELAAAAPDAAGRANEAARRVDAYLEAVAARRAELRPVPPLLAARLMEGEDAAINDRAIDRAVERARQLVNAAAGARSP